ncbi:MAG: hypothetical protein M0026_18570 [Nocardiopsaceae bacterium]|nr:hypothetical protein [Nocardiopsaceae bacterium]
MDDMSTIQALGLSPEAAEAVQRKAQAAQMTLSEYIRHLVETDIGEEAESGSAMSDAEIIAHNNAVLDGIAQNRDRMTSSIGTDGILAALREGRGE